MIFLTNVISWDNFSKNKTKQKVGMVCGKYNPWLCRFYLKWYDVYFE